MQKEYFKISKEINSLLTKKRDFEKLMDDENKRLQFIEQQRSKRMVGLAEKNNELNNLYSLEKNNEKELSHLQKSLNQTKGNLNAITDLNQEKAINAQLSSLIEKITQLEEVQFEILEQIESIEKDINQAQTFLNGSLNTLVEIQEEVQNNNTSYDKEINILNQRIENLIEQLPSKFKIVIDTALKRKLPISIFSKISNGKCDFCKLGLSKADEDGVEKRLELLTCSGCKRIFIPENSLY